jgi:SAM-dependent methyltransferase
MASASRRRILVTVGMGPWPFDRLVEAVRGLVDEHDVFVQTGTSTVDPGCPHAPFIGYQELVDRMADADIVITHAGNTVRLVQRAGGVPIAIARERSRGEMGNDHQVAYLRQEEEHGRVIAVWDVSSLPEAVAKHGVEAERLLADRRLAAESDPEDVADRLDATLARLTGRRTPEPARSTPGWDDRFAAGTAAPGRTARVGANPFARHPVRRYDFAWRQLAGRSGRPHDHGAGFGDVAGPVAASPRRRVSAVEAKLDYADEIHRRFPDLEVGLIRPEGHVPFDDATFASVSMLDVLEHVADERILLREAHRVLIDDGIAVVSVPRRHLFSWLDPDNAKYRWPRLHRYVYRRRFGDAAYAKRFGDTSDGFDGDIAVNRGWHTNYRTAELFGLLRECGFEPQVVEGANLFWRWFHIPYLLGGRRLKAVAERAIRIDGALFTSPRIAGNLFVVARRSA